MSIATLKRKTAAKYKNSSVSEPQFSINGSLRSQGWVGQSVVSRSFPRTVMKGDVPCGTSACCGMYQINPPIVSGIYNYNDSSAVKSSSLSSRGMMSTKYRWARRTYPYTSVKHTTTISHTELIQQKKNTIFKYLDALTKYNLSINSINKTGGNNWSNYTYNLDFSTFEKGYYDLIFNFTTSGVMKTVQAIPILTAVATNANVTIASTNVTTVSTGYEYALTNGTSYLASESSYNNSNLGFYMFNNNTIPYISGIGTYDAPTGAYIGSVSTTTTSGIINGEWVQIKLPYYLILNSFKIINAYNSNVCSIKNFSLLGSADAGTTWVVLNTGLFSTASRLVEETFTSTNTTLYNYYRLVFKDGYLGVGNRISAIKLTLIGKTYPLGNLINNLRTLEIVGLGSAENSYTTSTACQPTGTEFISSYQFNNKIDVFSKPLSNDITVILKDASGNITNIGEDYLLNLYFKRVDCESNNQLNLPSTLNRTPMM